MEPPADAGPLELDGRGWPELHPSDGGTAWERHDDPTVPDNPDSSHRSWCTQHLDQTTDCWNDGEQFDECGTAVEVLPRANGRQAVSITAAQQPTQDEPVVEIEATRPLSVAEARRLHSALGHLLGRVEQA